MVANAQDYQSRGHRFDPLLLQSFRFDIKTEVSSPYDLFIYLATRWGLPLSRITTNN